MNKASTKSQCKVKENTTKHRNAIKNPIHRKINHIAKLKTGDILADTSARTINATSPKWLVDP